ncbi:hypothetical protein Ahy_A09g042597 [Arachis hypogaea]|uniref:SWIM-type domain-containing protein n=1 Tax=Arachis hypogaea TaxID=3818 RepID=A0A445BGB3_ARAHY|nr:hypothetical protein Ahy_A09g042597 [Arachis hypogaea]
MDALRMLSCEMADWAGRFNKEIWLQHCDGGCRVENMTTNLSKCINEVLKDARTTDCSSCSSGRVRRHRLKWQRIISIHNGYRLRLKRIERGSFYVRLSSGTCNCRLFQSLHFSCRHALAACATADIEWGPYVHPVYF